MPRLTGNATVRMDGLSLRVKDAEIDLGGFERESKMADRKRVGYTEKPVPAMVRGTMIHGKDTDLMKVKDAASVTITFECDSGTTYTVRDACLTKTVKLKSEGEADVEFEGNTAF